MEQKSKEIDAKIMQEPTINTPIISNSDIPALLHLDRTILEWMNDNDTSLIVNTPVGQIKLSLISSQSTR